MKKHLFKLLLALIAIIVALIIIHDQRMPYGIGVGRSDFENCEAVYLYKGDTVFWAQTGNPNCVIEKKGKFFHYHEGNVLKTKFVWCDTWTSGTIIRGHIVDYIRNSDFLLSEQKPIDIILGEENTYYNDEGFGGYSQRENDTIHQFDAYWGTLNDNNTANKYWIIVINSADVYGPLSYEEYLDMKKKLMVPSTLMLKCEYATTNNN
jgi:hypothetical protein